jgi:hypothetical protein
VPDVGDVTTPTLTVSPFDGTTAATLTIYKPDGTTTTPTPTTADLGATWTSTAVIYDTAGWWVFDWAVTNTGAGHETQRVFVAATPTFPPNIPPIYATLDELKSRLGGVTGSSEDDALTNALTAASHGINLWCGRRFYRDDTASARVFKPVSPRVAIIDDFWTTDSLIVATGEGDDTFATTWTTADRQLEPLNGIVNGEPGWPYWLVRARNGSSFPAGSVGDVTVQVTAKWGWAAVPANVSEACRIVAEEIYKLKDAPFGVAGFGDMGVVRIRENPKVAAMLFRYQRDGVMVA